MEAVPGHFQLMAALRRAAYTDDNSLLFVAAGLDPERPLSEQSDSFWWGGASFARLDHAYGGGCPLPPPCAAAPGGAATRPSPPTILPGCLWGAAPMASSSAPA